MRILTVLTYYNPYTSGLSIYAERLVRGLLERGHQVTVLTSRFHPGTAREEKQDRHRIVRAQVTFRLGKGVIMPSFGRLATGLMKKHDIVHLHLPQFDAACVARHATRLGKPIVLTYHCDLHLSSGFFNFLSNRAVCLSNHLAGLMADGIVAYTSDFLEHSHFLHAFRHKTVVIPPPVEMAKAGAVETKIFIENYGVKGKGPFIGMAARMAAEKGVDVLLTALPRLLKTFPNAQVLFAGQYRGVLGEGAYARRLEPLLRHFRNCWRFLGVLDQKEMAAFYRCLDVLVVPSLNLTESFGLVQVEAMLSGVPVVASNLPGVRQPVLMTGMGETIPVGDSQALASAISRILFQKERYLRPSREIAVLFDPRNTAKAYESLFNRLSVRKGSG